MKTKTVSTKIDSAKVKAIDELVELDSLWKTRSDFIRDSIVSLLEETNSVRSLPHIRTRSIEVDRKPPSTLFRIPRRYTRILSGDSEEETRTPARPPTAIQSSANSLSTSVDEILKRLAERPPKFVRRGHRRPDHRVRTGRR